MNYNDKVSNQCLNIRLRILDHQLLNAYILNDLDVETIKNEK